MGHFTNIKSCSTLYLIKHDCLFLRELNSVFTFMNHVPWPKQKNPKHPQFILYKMLHEVLWLKLQYIQEWLGYWVMKAWRILLVFDSENKHCANYCNNAIRRHCYKWLSTIIYTGHAVQTYDTCLKTPKYDFTLPLDLWLWLSEMCKA